MNDSQKSVPEIHIQSLELPTLSTERAIRRLESALCVSMIDMKTLVFRTILQRSARISNLMVSAYFK